MIAEEVAARLRRHEMKACTLAVNIKDCDLQTRAHQMRLKNPTDITAEIYKAACQCFEEMWDGYPLRLIGISTSRMEEETTRQLSLFDNIDYEKQKKAEQAMDELREKFGDNIIVRARLK